MPRTDIFPPFISYSFLLQVPQVEAVISPLGLVVIAVLSSQSSQVGL
jgi:hypothetical protein